MYYLVVLLRIIAAPLVFISPLIAIILSVFLDIIDGDLACLVISKNKYEEIDKNLDFWWFANIMIYSYSHYPQYKLFLFALFIFRFIGQALFAVSYKRIFLMYFPNFFEWSFFLIFLGVNYFPIVINSRLFYLNLGMIFILKIFQEWFIHVADLSVKEILSGKKRNWVS